MGFFGAFDTSCVRLKSGFVFDGVQRKISRYSQSFGRLLLTVVIAVFIPNRETETDSRVGRSLSFFFIVPSVVILFVVFRGFFENTKMV